MKKVYIFCHGFGFDNTYWGNLAPYFKNQEKVFLNLGYFGQKNIPSILKSYPIDSYEYIGIGHSLGLISLLQLNLPFKALIGLNGFINFIGSEPTIFKKRSIELKLLKQSFITNEQKTLNDFYNRCEVEKNLIPTQKLNKEEILLAFDNLKIKFNINSKIKFCIIGANNDIIVPPKLIEDNFNTYANIKQVFLKNGGHSLGSSKVVKIKDIIEEFLNDEL